MKNGRRGAAGSIYGEGSTDDATKGGHIEPHANDCKYTGPSLVDLMCMI